MGSSLSISSSCAECYFATAQYGFKNCKVACLAGWCKSGCLSCTAPAQATLGTCAGFSPAAADPCDGDEDVTAEAMGGCNAADQANLADAKNVGDKQDACGKQALGLTGIDHDKFTSCAMSLSPSALPALSATLPLRSTASRTARSRAWQVGASRAVSAARRLPRPHLELVPASPQQQPILAMGRMCPCEFRRLDIRICGGGCAHIPPF